MNKLSETPVNGTALTLYADGGEYGELVPCPACETKDAARAKRCKECAGDGELHRAWHPVGDACRWVVQTPDTPRECCGGTQCEIEVPVLTTAQKANQALVITFIAAGFITLLSALVIRLTLWIIGTEL